MMTTEQATRFCKFKTSWQFRYAVKKAGIKHKEKIGMTKMWDEKDLTNLIQKKEQTDEK